MSSPYLYSGSVPENYDKYLGPVMFEPYVLDLVQRLNHKKGNRVLEIACGTGRVTSHLAKLTTSADKITATDINADMLSVAKSKVPNESIIWQEADATDLPFSDGAFDIVICQFGVMFFPDKPAAFKEAYRVLTPTGNFLFNVWDAVQYNEGSLLLKEVLDELFQDEAPDFLNKGAYSYHNEAVITSALTTAGFTNITMDKVTRTISFASLHDFIKGFFDGTPLSLFFSYRDASARMMAENRIRERLSSEIADGAYSYKVQALVFEVEK